MVLCDIIVKKWGGESMKNKIAQILKIFTVLILLVTIINIVPNSIKSEDPPELGYKAVNTLKV